MCCDDSQKDVKEQQLQMKSQQKQLKIVILGESSVGKTSLISKFCFDTFSSKEPTLGVAYQNAQIQIRGQLIKLHIWDTAGEERYRSLAQLCYRDANMAIIVYDIGKESSFQQINYWYNELSDKCQSVCIGLAGNKCDMNELRVVDKVRGNEFAKTNDLIFVETSAKTGEGVQILFQMLVDKYLKLNK